MKIHFFTRTVLVSLLFSFSFSAHAGLFDDDEARRAILDLRIKVEELTTRLENKIESKSDKNSALTLANQNEQLQQEINRLKGQIEVLSNNLSKLELQQKNLYLDLDKRLQKLEPQKITVDGKEVAIEPIEQKAYDIALNNFKDGNYKRAITLFSNFTTNYPQSALIPTAYYWLGTSYYAIRDYKNAIATQQLLVKNYPTSTKAVDALLNIVNCYTELKDKNSAKKTLEKLIAQYPNSDAAKSAQEQLQEM